mgnify:FL=1|tara:strand:- start:54 stop:1400 length:1347 start_codon:yes stop_codon:yes gene_type:complete
MKIVEDKLRLEELQTTLKSSDSFWIPVFSDIYRHYVNNQISFVYIYIFDTKKEYIVPYRHMDCLCLESDHLNNLTSNANIFVLGKKRFINFYHHNTYDADLVEYFQSNKMLQLEDTDTNAHDWYNKWYYNETNVNDYIPIVKHFERCSAMKDKFVESYNTFKMSDSFEYYNELFIDNLYAIERNGLRVDYPKFVEKFQTNNLVNSTAYTEYNIYTSTGRPSNKHGGVNYAAINKENGSRESFVSRHEYGMLIELDYDSYHLRLIGDLIDYKLPESSVHTYLGKQYFGKEELSEEEYNQSKTISFRLLYGGVDKDFAKIPYFGKVREYTYKLWDIFQEQGYIETVLLKRKLFKTAMTDMNPSKLFNYYLQSMETEYNMSMINKINALLGPYETKLVLYTYDSLLFDFAIKDGKQLILDIKETMTDKKFPVKIKAGKTMQDLQNMTDKIS